MVPLSIRVWRPTAILAAAALAFSLAACANQSNPLPTEPTASNAVEKTKSQQKAETRAAAAALNATAQADLKDTDAVIKAVRALRAASERSEALTLLEKAEASQPKNLVLMREKGLIALELGQLSHAEQLLGKSLDQGKGDWQTYSALGAAFASAGKHQQAQKQFAKALELAPDHPSVLNNLALSYALDGKPAEAERILRVAASGKDAPPQVAQNLALVLGTRGKLSEAEKVAGLVRSKASAQGNAAYLKSLAERATADGSIKSADAQKETLSQPYLLGAATNR